ncbi:hypothetical protein HZS_6996 [Henneguya salminicola]|nr:hypothetical protein HZS_6996 [Henneguya salminicola]
MSLSCFTNKNPSRQHHDLQVNFFHFSEYAFGDEGNLNEMRKTYTRTVDSMRLVYSLNEL